VELSLALINGRHFQDHFKAVKTGAETSRAEKGKGGSQNKVVSPHDLYHKQF
jgi:hypothetical protein